jgi:hypothetical protein
METSTISQMKDVGIEMPDDILTYDLLCRIPASLDNIKKKITHSKDGKDIRPEVLINHLEIHLNELNVSNRSKSESLEATMFTKEDTNCKGFHHPFSTTHIKDNCWKIYLEKKEDSRIEC